jgi:hypothetical protein
MDEQPLPSISYSDRIGWYEHQPGTARERFAEAHADVDAERLRRERDLTDFLGCAWFWGKSGRCL